MKVNCSCVYYYYYCIHYFVTATIVTLLLNVLHSLFKIQDVSGTGCLFFFRYERGKPNKEDRLS